MRIAIHKVGEKPVVRDATAAEEAAIVAARVEIEPLPDRLAELETRIAALEGKR